MNPVDTTPLPPVKTAPPAGGIKLTPYPNGEKAPHDGKNLIIHIDIGPDKATATPHSQLNEYVGSHKQRYVLFSANTHCWLTFDSRTVFVDDYVELTEGETVRVPVPDKIQKGNTKFTIVLPKTANVAKMAKTAKAEPLVKQGPVIVVP